MNATAKLRSGLGLGLCLLPPGLFLFDTGLPLLLGHWRPYGSIELLVLFLGTLLALGWMAGLVLLRGHMREMLLLIGAVLIAGLLLELGAAQLEKKMRRDPFFHTRGPGVHQVFHPDPALIAGIRQPATYTTNPQGIRICRPYAPESDRKRLLCVGGSTTECVYLDDCASWPALLMQALPALWVGSVGISGFDSGDHLRFLKNSSIPDQAEVIVFQIGINDLWRYLAGEEEAILYDRFDAESKTSTVATAEAEAPWRPYWSRSRLIQFYHTFRTQSARQVTVSPRTVEGAGGAEYRIRREGRQSAAKTARLPDLSSGLARYQSRVNALIQAARKRGLVPVFLSQPVLWRADLSEAVAERCWFGWLPDGSYLSLGALRQAMDAYNEALREVCIACETPLVDLGSMQGNATYFYDDCHFTESGAQAVAGLAGPVLEQVVEDLD